MRKCKAILEFEEIIQVEGGTYLDLEMKFKWSFCFLFLRYFDDIIDNIMEQYTESTTELLEKSTSTKSNSPPLLSSSYEQVDLEEAVILVH